MVSWIIVLVLAVGALAFLRRKPRVYTGVAEEVAVTPAVPPGVVFGAGGIFIPLGTAEGSSVVGEARAVANSIAQEYAAKGLNIEIHSITPGYLNLGSRAMPRTFSGVVRDNCAIVICGFEVNETQAGTLRISKGREYVTTLNLRPIYDFAELGRAGVDDGFRGWGVYRDGEPMAWSFQQTAKASLNAWPVGYIVCPEGASRAI